MNLDLPRTDKLNQTALPCSNRRGSTILLVLAMLSILLLLGIAFSYSTRLESQASFNYAELAQARSSASSGLPMAMPMLAQASMGLTSTLQNWSTIPQALNRIMKSNGKSAGVTAAQMAQMRQSGVNVRRDSSGELQSAPQANIEVRDLSSLVNINAVENETVMQRVVQAVLPGSDVRQKSAALMTLRGDAPGLQRQSSRNAQMTDSEPADLDPRDPNAQMLDSLARLQISANSGQRLFTEDEIEKLATFVTVFSQAPEVFNGPDGVHVPRIALDAIEPKRVYDTLRQAFPNKKNELLLQFAANLADFSDEDDEPTVLDASGNPAIAGTDGSFGANATIGVEMTPLISEVYPDAATSVGFGDDGQFVEIFNPWQKTISLVGWTLRTGTGASIQLTAQLPPGGMLLVTDNFDTPKPDSPPGYGSVVSLFGASADGSMRQVMTQPALEIPDRNNRISLYNPNGRLADVFTYGSIPVDGKQSFQRNDPLVRGSSKSTATPLTQGSIFNSSNMAAATKAWEDGNSTMTKVSQLFTLSTGFVERIEGDTDVTGEKVHGSQMAELKLPEDFNPAQQTDEDPYPDNMDLRLIDIFTATPTPVDSIAEAPDSNEDSDQARSAYQAFREKMDRLRNRNQGSQANANTEETTSSTVYSYGKLNINTCPKYALLGLTLDSMVTNNGKNGVAGMLEQFEGYRLRNAQQGRAPFNNVSDFVVQFAPNLSRGNLGELDSITDQVTVGSSAFEITSTNRLSPDEQKALESNDNADGPRPATATAKWVISMDQKPYSVVSFTLAP